VLGKRYNFMQIVAVMAASLGVGLASFSAFKQKNPDAPLDSSTVSLPGLLCMAGALTMVALLGATQEYICRKFGKECMSENLFYMHFVGLPLFYSKWDSIVATTNTWWTSDKKLSVFGIEVPYFLFLLVMNTLMGDILKRGTSKLIALTSSLSANLVVSFMRFLALLLSAYVINAPPFPPHALFLSGAALILTGSILYAAGSPPAKAATATPTLVKDPVAERREMLRSLVASSGKMPMKSDDDKKTD
jgi:UDP-xylose/UDP-N-acetylglucosamine transporter B4